MLQKTKALIFDFDDTILATFMTRVPCVIKAASDFGYTLSAEDIRLVWGKPFQEMIFALMPNIDYREWYYHYQIVMARYKPELMPGARAIIEYVKELGLYSAVVSSSSKLLVKQDLEEVSMLDLVDSVWGF